MSRLEIRLFGGLLVSFGGARIDSFESQKVRALLAYLARGRQRIFSRDQLSGLFWPETSSDNARRNLRQALYSLRRAIAEEAGEDFEALDVSHQTIQLGEGDSIWVDVVEFQDQLLRARTVTGGPRMTHLAKAARLYSGDFLAGFHVKNCAAFEEWWAQEQELHREAATSALRTLVEHHLKESTPALGIQFAWQLAKIDPLAEDAHRQLMELLSLSGRRGRAITVFQDLCRTLQDELGVEPSEETVAIYEKLLADTSAEADELPAESQRGPNIPLIGRQKEVERLQGTWKNVLSGKGALTVVEGEQGVGKTRLLLSAIHEVTGGRRSIVLRGRFQGLSVPVCFGGFREAVRNTVVHEPNLAEKVIARASEKSVATLSLLVPSLGKLHPNPPDPPEASSLEAITEALACFLRELCRPAEPDGEADPVVLFLDDLQWADPASLQVLSDLALEIQNLPVWIVGARESALEGLGNTAGDADEGLEAGMIVLGRLASEDMKAMAAALVESREQDPLAELLSLGAGLPLQITELVNLLWDREILVPGTRGRLHLRQQALELDLSAVQGRARQLAEIIRQRLATLPASARRLLTLAVVAGPGFDADLLRSAELEHEKVVEIGLQVLLERRMIRPLLGYWADSRQDRDLALWTSGTAKGTFEFIHPAIRWEVYYQLDPLRRRILHRRIAQVLEERQRQGNHDQVVLLAHHCLQAGDGWAAAEHLCRASEEARRLGAEDTARRYLQIGVDSLDRARENVEKSSEGLRLLQAREELQRELSRISDG